jgi:predicted nucleic acid-binding protein
VILHLDTSFLVNLLRERSRETKAPAYGRILASLQRRGEIVATMDLLIGLTALLEGAPLVTRNAAHFERVQDLRVLQY